jgi:hypothetical protein
MARARAHQAKSQYYLVATVQLYRVPVRSWAEG